jgi:hypothetical protein
MPFVRPGKPGGGAKRGRSLLNDPRWFLWALWIGLVTAWACRMIVLEI